MFSRHPRRWPCSFFFRLDPFKLSRASNARLCGHGEDDQPEEQPSEPAEPTAAPPSSPPRNFSSPASSKFLLSEIQTFWQGPAQREANSTKILWPWFHKVVNTGLFWKQPFTKRSVKFNMIILYSYSILYSKVLKSVTLLSLSTLAATSDFKDSTVPMDLWK